jgi:CubicO group peptidase (beta-lactamase class C family)
MVQKGVIHLDEPVANYLPEIRSVRQKGADASGAITFRQLADHTSGLVREPELPYAAAGPIETWEDKVLKAIPTTTLNPPAGKTFLYSNIGYAILGLAISRAAHKPFMELVEDSIFCPHGMKNSFYSIPKGFEDRIAKGYSWNAISSTYESRQAEAELTGRGYKVPNGGVFTTANDLARFVSALMADTDLLARNFKDSMQRVQTPRNNNSGYGLGLQIANNNTGVKMIGHGGLVAGFGSYMVFNPASGIGVVVLRNCDDDPSIEFKANMLLNNLVHIRTQQP